MVEEGLDVKYCQHCGAEVSENAFACVKCGCLVQSINNVPTKKADNSVGKIFNMPAVISSIISGVAIIFSLFPCIFETTCWKESVYGGCYVSDSFLVSMYQIVTGCDRWVLIALYVGFIAFIAISAFALIGGSSWKVKALSVWSSVAAFLMFVFFCIIVVDSVELGYTGWSYGYLDRYYTFDKVGWGFFVELFLLTSCVALNFIIVCGKGSRTNKKTQVGLSEKDVRDIERYKELLDKGILTQKEFDTKKSKLLGL